MALSEDCLKKLDWLVEERQKKTTKKVYPCKIVQELINNEYTIRQAFK
ncbi:hypothetical protein RV10_GL003747 [Enterococcus pallens]|nr:hypothetical protein RV10_GL003747 [Enterococcus pallens]